MAKTSSTMDMDSDAEDPLESIPSTGSSTDKAHITRAEENTWLTC